MKRQAATIVEGGQGSGKTYAVVQHLCDEFLREEDGLLYTNIDLNIEAVALEVERRSGKQRSADSVRERLVILNNEHVNTLRRDVFQGGTTPLRLLPRASLSSGCLVVLDEAHHFAGSDKSMEHIAEWKEWLGEIRKDGMTVYLITPNRSNIHHDIEALCFGLWMAISVDELRDPFFKVPLKVWYQFEAKFRGFYRAAVEFRFCMREGKRYVEKHRQFYRMQEGPSGFDLYNSFSARQGMTESGERPKEEWEKRTWLRLIGWALYHHDSLWSIPLKWASIASLIMLAAWYFDMWNALPFQRSKPPPKPVAVAPPPIDPRIGSLQTTLNAQQTDIRNLQKDMRDFLQDAEAKRETIVGFVGARFMDGKGEWHVSGDKYADSTITAVDADLGLVRLQNGREVALRSISQADSGILASAASIITGSAPARAVGDAERGGNAPRVSPQRGQPSNIRQPDRRSTGGASSGDGPPGLDAD